MLEVPRQQISELFLVLLLLLITTSEMDRIKRLCLTIIFSMSLAVSHYGLSFIYLFAVIYTWIILFFIKMDLMKLLLLIKSNYLIKYFKHKKENKLIQDPTKEFFSFTYVMFMIVFTLGWYKCISDSSVYDTVVYILDSFISGLTTGLLNPNKVEALNAIFKDSSIVYNIIKYLHLLTQFFIVIGFFSSIKSRKKLGKDYFIFTSFFLGICFISLVAPNLSENIGTSRLYSICLIPLSLFCVIGFIRIFEILTRYLTSSNTQPKNIFKFFAIFISIFFMFNSGLISHFAQEHLSSIALDELKTREVYNDSDFFGTQWAAENTKQNNLNIYTGTFEAFMLLDFMSKNDINLYDSKTEYLFPFSYILIGPISVQDNEIVERYFKSTGVDFEYFAYKGSIFYNKIVSKSSKIYDNGAINTFFYSSSFDLL
jgi:uncharacterized membrane protein